MGVVDGESGPILDGDLALLRRRLRVRPRPGPRRSDHAWDWFAGARLNYVEHVFRHADPNKPAIVSATEDGGVAVVSRRELRSMVARPRTYRDRCSPR
jgi:hypothetical protein